MSKHGNKGPDRQPRPPAPVTVEMLVSLIGDAISSLELLKPATEKHGARIKAHDRQHMAEQFGLILKMNKMYQDHIADLTSGG